MKLKAEPGDFRVRELLEFEPDRHGPFYIHKLTKQKCDTLQALAIVAREAQVDRGLIAFAGLKDRQGVTEQYISIEGQRVEFRKQGVQVRFVGRSAEPITSKHSQGNAFSLKLRDLHRKDAEELVRRVARLDRDGYVNYFDDQRFGALTHGQGFVMKDVLRGRFDQALRGLIARPSPRARGGDVELKKLLAKHWGDWETCGRIARGPVWERLFHHLVHHPGGFRDALELLPTRQKLIHAFAYQSYLWNRAVDLMLRDELPPYKRIWIDTIPANHVSWRRLSDTTAELLDRLETPLFGADGDGGSPRFRAATEQVLKDAGLTREHFAGNSVQGMVLREEPREVRVHPKGLRVTAPIPDDRNRGRSMLEFDFALPRGAYATMLIKHLTADDPPRGAPRPRGRGEGSGRR